MSPTSIQSPSSFDDDDLLNELHALHADEIAYLHKNVTALVKNTDRSWILRSFVMIRQYFVFVFLTWKRALWSFLFYPTTMMDRVGIVVISFALCVAMSVLLPWCLLCNIPSMGRWFNNLSKKLFNGLGLVNASYPTMFDSLSREQIGLACGHLAQDIKDASSTQQRRVFNLDASKLLLQCASLMYERTSHTPIHAASMVDVNDGHSRQRRMTDWSYSRAGQRIEELCGHEGAEAVTAALHSASAEENTIQSIAREKLGLDFTTVSDLNSAGGSFCGLFWDPRSNFVIVAFKGTTPTDFMEWNTDFTINLRDAGQWLSGFGKVHDGFMGKTFPHRIAPGSRMPYDTINEAIRMVTRRLRDGKSEDLPINVWITGHSLGCALASLAYSRLICEPHELGPHIVVRDAYLFAAPVTCDAESAGEFNNKMNRFHKHPKTMWRVTNGKDAVATALPDAGDNTEWTLSPYNLFSFAHLGAEIQLRPVPHRSIVKGTHIIPGTHVVIESATPSDEAKGAAREYKETPLYETMKWTQNLPLVGRLIAHGTGYYWNEIQAVAPGSCEWDYDD